MKLPIYVFRVCANCGQKTLVYPNGVCFDCFWGRFGLATAKLSRKELA